MAIEEMLDTRQAADERVRQFGEGRGADNDQQSDAVPNDSSALIGLVANAMIVGQRNPATLTHDLQPRLVGGVRRKVVVVQFYCKASGFENLGKAFAEIAIGEIDKAQAARS